MKTALATLDFDETKDTRGARGTSAPRTLFSQYHLPACDRMRAVSDRVSSSYEWYNPSEIAHYQWAVIGGCALQIEKQAALMHNLQQAWQALEAQAPGLEYELSALAQEWKRTRQKTNSSVLKMVMLPAYQRIIGKGRAAIPFLLREMEREPDHWFWALNAITGEDPVPEEDRGDLQAMTNAWIAWGWQHGYV